MSLNLTFTGNIFNSATIAYISNEVNYQVYFYKVNSTSSTSKWSNIRSTSFGQYNFNLADSDLLGTDGIASSGDRILILFWTPNTEIRSSLVLTEWSMIEHTLSASTLYTQDVQTLDPQNPNCDFTINSTNTVQTNITITDFSSDDSQMWSYASMLHYQIPTKYGQSIFDINSLPFGSIDIDWDDSNSSLNQNPGSTYTHVYSSSGDYNISVTLTNNSSLTCNQIISKRIYWREPDTNFSISNTNPNPQGENGLGEEITFTNTTNDPDSRASIDSWNWDWTISDTGAFGNFTDTQLNKTYIFSPTHEFGNPGTHNITLITNWYDGFSWNTNTEIKFITQEMWDIVCGLNWSPPVYKDIEKVFTPNITGDVIHITNVDYTVDYTTFYNSYSYTDELHITFDISDNHTITQIIDYHNGFELSIKTDDFSVTMNSICNFIVTDSVCGKHFSDDSIAGKPPFINYKWEILHGGNIIASFESSVTDYFDYAWPYIGLFDVKHTIKDSNNEIVIKTENFEITECPVGGGPGETIIIDRGSSYGFIEREKIPRLRVQRVKLEDELNIEVKLSYQD